MLKPWTLDFAKTAPHPSFAEQTTVSMLRLMEREILQLVFSLRVLGTWGFQ
jgi:hypothetical protein